MRPGSIVPLLVALATLSAPAVAQQPQETGHAEMASILTLASPDAAAAEAAMKEVAPLWRDGYAAILIDLARFMRPPRRARAGGGSADDPRGATGMAPAGGTEQRQRSGRGVADRSAGRGGRPDPGSPVRRRLLKFLKQQTGQRLGDDMDRWRYWLWEQDYDPHPEYARFKAGLYGNIDPTMSAFFPEGVQSLIRMDQIDWGGVVVNGIPPLDYPARVPAAEAGYLGDKNVVFGIAINGEARAYPKRIIAWHEMALDKLGGVELAIVYCTLCGTVIPYETEVDGTRHVLGTSGLLYRSNKLMFDERTKSLWNTALGEPVVGPLVGAGIKLKSHPVVTTTWAEWKKTHPETTVLALDTGYQRDYSEGAAYRDYFSSDRVMFAVPGKDGRLKNKDEVLVLPYSVDADAPLAISVKLLGKKRVYRTEHAGKQLVVLTTAGGANRVYDVSDETFTAWHDNRRVKDGQGRLWRVNEDALIPETEGLSSYPRLAAHRSFWFAWFAQHPDTALLK